MELSQLEDRFIDIGGQFYTSGFDLREKLPEVKALIFSWDGVFNDGGKSREQSSRFSEIDAKGLDMLRFGFFLAYGHMPRTAIISAGSAEDCLGFGQREHLDRVYHSSYDKMLCFQHFVDLHRLKPSEVIFLYGDVNDIAVAAQCGIRMAVGRLSSPVFMDHLEKNKLVDYISSCHGHEHVIREFSELLLGLLDRERQVFEERSNFSQGYLEYFRLKEGIDTIAHKCESVQMLGLR